MAKHASGRSRQRENQGSIAYLEALENRILFNVFTLDWKLNTPSGNFNDQSKWAKNGASVGVGPTNNNGADQVTARFQNVGAVTVHVTADVTISDIVISGDSQVTLEFDGAFNATRTLTLEKAGGVDGYLAFTERQNKTTSLELKLDGNLAHGSLLAGSSTVFTGDSKLRGHTTLKVGEGVDAVFDGGVMADNRRFDVTVDEGGLLQYGGNAYLMGFGGKNSNLASTIGVNGVLIAGGRLLIGGDGLVNMTVNGLAEADDLVMGYLTTLTINQDGAYLGKGSATINGEPTTWHNTTGSPEPINVANNLQGGILDVEDGGLFELYDPIQNLYGSFTVLNGTKTAVTVLGGSQFFVGYLNIGSGGPGIAGPQMTVAGKDAVTVAPSRAVVNYDFTIGQRDAGTFSGRLIVALGGNFEVKEKATIDSDMDQNAAFNGGYHEVSVYWNGVFAAHELQIGGALGYANVLVGNKGIMGTTIPLAGLAPDVILGDGVLNHHAVLQVDKGGKFEGAGKIVKNQKFSYIAGGYLGGGLLTAL